MLLIGPSREQNKSNADRQQFGCTPEATHGKMTSMIPRLLSPAADSGNAPEKFEELLARLEQIVNDMENADMPLEKLLASYEEGMRLVKVCGGRLTDAEQKVEILSRAVATEPAKSTLAGTTEESPVPPKDEIKLF